jgi:hypothetical protein
MNGEWIDYSGIRSRRVNSVHARNRWIVVQVSCRCATSPIAAFEAGYDTRSTTILRWISEVGQREKVQRYWLVMVRVMYIALEGADGTYAAVHMIFHYSIFLLGFGHDHCERRSEQQAL